MHDGIVSVNPQADKIFIHRGIAQTVAEWQVGTMMTAKEIKAVRLGLGESQHAFARRLGVGQPTIFRWESNGLPPSALRFIRAVNTLTVLGRRGNAHAKRQRSAKK